MRGLPADHSSTLTEDDLVILVEHSLSQDTDGEVEQKIHAATSLVEAVAALKKHLLRGVIIRNTYVIDWHKAGVRMESGDRLGQITYEELVRRIRSMAFEQDSVEGEIEAAPPIRTGPLTEEDKAILVEQSLMVFQDRWVERGILEAPDDTAAAAVARKRLGVGGSCRGDYMLDWRPDGITMKRGGRSGHVSYADLVRRVRYRAPVVSQLALFAS